MPKFEILCTTMNQSDFSKAEEMNIHCNTVFANQAGTVGYDEKQCDGYKLRMITTDTRGVGKNRNIAMLYANADYCLFADDDCRYNDDVEKTVIDEFEAHPDADVFIFHLDTDDKIRSLEKYKKTKRYSRFGRRPWGCVRVAFKLASAEKANLSFNTLFGGGCIFPSGEDSMWISDAFKKGLRFYVSDKTIGFVSMKSSSWFTGVDGKYYFAKGAHYRHSHKKTIWIWMIYFALRTVKMTDMSFGEKIKWMRYGADAYQKFIPYDEYVKHEIKS